MSEEYSNFKKIIQTHNDDEDLSWLEDDTDFVEDKEKVETPVGSNKSIGKSPFKVVDLSANKEIPEKTSSLVPKTKEGIPKRPTIEDIRLQGIKGERIRRIVSDIIYLTQLDPSWPERGVIDKVKKYHRFLIKDALHIVKGLESNSIEYDPTDYKVTIEKLGFRSQFRDITEDDYKLLFPCLTERQCRLYRVIRSLKEIAKTPAAENVDYDGQISYYVQEEAYTPSLLNFHFTKFNYYKVNYKASDFRASIKRDVDKNQFASLKENQIKRIWAALTNYQKKVYNEEYSDNPIPLDFGYDY